MAERSKKEEQWNGQNLKQLKYYLELEVYQFLGNEICDMLIDTQT